MYIIKEAVNIIAKIEAHSGTVPGRCWATIEWNSFYA
jgi:hypothetical protein